MQDLKEGFPHRGILASIGNLFLADPPYTHWCFIGYVILTWVRRLDESSAAGGCADKFDARSVNFPASASRQLS